MRIGIIDLGTNSIRFSIFEVDYHSRVKEIYKDKLMVRLGHELFVKYRLDPVAVRRTVAALSQYKKIADMYGVRRLRAFGTCALREARDSGRFIKMVKQLTGIDINVISGKREGDLIASGILMNQKRLSGRLALIDIGGGSTEVSLCSGKRILRSASFNFGAARLQQMFLKKSPPSLDSVQLTRLFLQNALNKEFRKKRWLKVKRVFGSSGTVKTYIKVIQKKYGRKKPVSIKMICRVNKKFESYDLGKLKDVSGIDKERVDIILSGGIILEEIMRALGARYLKRTEYSLRDGILVEELKNRRCAALSI